VRYSILAGAFATVLVLVSSGLRPTAYDNYALLATAIAHGHLWIDWPGVAIDALPFDGRYYVIEGPLPGLLLVPFAWLAGGEPNQVIIGVLFAGIAIGAAWELCRRLGLSSETTAWLCLFLFAGTDLWWCANLGDVWFVAHLGAAAFTLLALAEFLGARRGWMLGALFGCAALCRFSLAAALPIMLLVLARSRDPRRSGPAFLAALVPFAAFWVLYNELRWHVPYDIGYVEWFHQDPIGLPNGSPFSLRYVSRELYSFFVRPPMLLDRPPWIQPSFAGMALEFTSPALALAFLARTPRSLVATMWALTLAVAAPSFLYYANGASQFGMRHALDFEPFLVVLMAVGVRERLPAWGAVLIVVSAMMGMWGIWFWHVYVRGA
jgi:hypothetical protein